MNGLDHADKAGKSQFTSIFSDMYLKLEAGIVIMFDYVFDLSDAKAFDH